MKLNIVKYLIISLLLTNCIKQEREIKDYGSFKKENDDLMVSLQLSEFENYGMLVDRIREITCNDSIPKIVIEKSKLTRNIYPIEHCEPISFHPKEKHYVTFRSGKPYQARSTIEIEANSLNSKLRDDFSYYRSSNHTENLERYLVILEAERRDKVDGIEDFLIKLTKEYDLLKTDLELNISFWEFVDFIPPPPRMENEETD